MDIIDIDDSLDRFIADAKIMTSKLADIDIMAKVSDPNWVETVNKRAYLMPDVRGEHFDPDEKGKAKAWLS